jgi:O-antigen/teichoic acid export membrane protein
MPENNQSRYTQYFLKGVQSNILNVSTSWLLGLITNIVLFNTLSNSDYIFYSVSHLTIYFFVSFSQLEFDKLVMKYFPNMIKKYSDALIFKLIFTSTLVLVVIFSFFTYISIYLDLYSYFEQSVNIFYSFVFLSSLLQIVSNFFGQYLSANQKFHIQEFKYFKYSTPVRAIGLAIFYLYFRDVIFILFISFIVRLINLIITFTVSGADFKNYRTTQVDDEVKLKFSTKKNLSFTYKNFIFFNYPLIFFSYLPLYLTSFHTENDIAVLSLAITLFNSVKPFLKGVHSVLNPAIQQLKYIKEDVKLFKIIHIVFLLFHALTLFGLVALWALLNFTPFTTGLFNKFSFNLFSDLALTSTILSLMYILCMITHSYFLSIDYENKILLASLVAMLFSMTLWFQYESLGRKINFSLIIIFTFYFVYFILSHIFSYDLYKNKIFYTLGISIFYFICLRTFFYSSYVLFIILNVLNLTILLLIVKNILKNHDTNLKNLFDTSFDKQS